MNLKPLSSDFLARKASFPYAFVIFLHSVYRPMLQTSISPVEKTLSLNDEFIGVLPDIFSHESYIEQWQCFSLTWNASRRRSIIFTRQNSQFYQKKLFERNCAGMANISEK